MQLCMYHFILFYCVFVCIVIFLLFLRATFVQNQSVMVMMMMVLLTVMTVIVVYIVRSLFAY